MKSCQYRSRRLVSKIGKNEFTATFDFEDFKKFVLKVADEAVKYMQREIDN